MNRPEVKRAIESASTYYVSGFFLTVSVPAILKVAEHAAKVNKVFSFNLAAPFLMQVPIFAEAMEKVLPYCDIVFGNETEAEAFSEKFMNKKATSAEVAKFISGSKKINSQRPRICCITQGSTSTVVSVNGSDAQAFPVRKLDKKLIVDTNGAGDAFVGGFFAKYLCGADLKHCVESGHETARLIIQQSGCKL